MSRIGRNPIQQFITPALDANQFYNLTCDGTGATRVLVVAGGAFPTIAAADDMANPTTQQVIVHLTGFDGATWDRIRTMADDADGVVPVALGLARTGSMLFGFDGTNWDRVRAVATNVDDVAVLTDGALVTASHLYGFDSIAWDRLRTYGNNDDNVAVVAAGHLGTASWLFGFDGTTWDRVRSFAGDADNVAAPTLGLLGTAAFAYGFDGATWDRLRVNASSQLIVQGAGSDGTAYITGGGTTAVAAGFMSSALDAQILLRCLIPEISGLANTQGIALSCGADGRARVDARLSASALTDGSWTLYTGAAAVGTAGVVIKASAGRLRALRATNTSATGRYLHIHNRAVAPINTNSPVVRAFVPGNTTFTFEVLEGMFLSTGIAYALSTTAVDTTLLGADDFVTDALYA